MTQGILLIAEHRQGALRPASLELITAAQSLRALGGKLSVALIGRDAAALAPGISLAGVDEIVHVETVDPEFEPDAWEDAVAALVESIGPAVVLAPHSVDSMGYAAGLAIRAGLGFATDVFGVDVDGGKVVATRGGYGQKVNVELEFPERDTVLLTIRGGAFKAPVDAASPAVRKLDYSPAPSRTRNLQFIEPVATGDVDMSSQDFILSVGRGVGEESNIERFRELADTLGATLGCSRPVADSGWLPKSRQIGQSGKTATQCKLYVAMGISGAIQHLAGMKHVDTVIAINSDPNASIFTVARYGVVGDMFEIADELERLAG